MSKQTATDYLIQEIKNDALVQAKSTQEWNEVFQIAKQMEREQIDKFNDFLEKEKQFEISDLKTIERIQWYYNTYFNETYGGQDENNS
jgi:hypothetical protein